MFIANSHFKGVYPTDLLSFGGGFGLALFYMISGFLLADMCYIVFLILYLICYEESW